ncbi:GNAT family N-acetyltransferase [Longirhabdus pacifica]|uniref:GNAT family N-acetyltransferase n=1 Tax=Longirhabdus pacifica TaxID=2305227 RepID=UPI001008F4DB|nr:GNAT family N-acetyltransferase [Longirhabdus pacifica]
MHIVSCETINKKDIETFLIRHWGSTHMVISSGVYDCSQLAGFAAIQNDRHMVGLITYIIKDKICEIISLDSVEERKGIGTELLHAVEEDAKKQRLDAINVITTNDNLQALKFYQKRGYRMQTIYPNAVDKARAIKPQIPLIGHDDIPITDEIELCKVIQIERKRNSKHER